MAMEKPEEVAMFAITCTTTDSTVLLSASSIVALRNTPAGIEPVLECHCGEHLTVVQPRTAAAVARLTGRPTILSRRSTGLPASLAGSLTPS